jgi:hypothetical protein
MTHLLITDELLAAANDALEHAGAQVAEQKYVRLLGIATARAIVAQSETAALTLVDSARGQAEEHAQERAADKARIAELTGRNEDLSAALGFECAERDKMIAKAERERDEARTQVHGIAHALEACVVSDPMDRDCYPLPTAEIVAKAKANAQAARELARAREMADMSRPHFGAGCSSCEEMRKLLGSGNP